MLKILIALLIALILLSGCLQEKELKELSALPNGEIKIVNDSAKNYDLTLIFSVETDLNVYPKAQEIITDFNVQTGKVKSSKPIENASPETGQYLMPIITQTLQENGLKSSEIFRYTIPSNTKINESFSVPILRKLPISSLIRVSFQRTPSNNSFPKHTIIPLWPKISGKLETNGSIFDYEFYRPIKDLDPVCIQCEKDKCMLLETTATVYNDSKVSWIFPELEKKGFLVCSLTFTDDITNSIVKPVLYPGKEIVFIPENN